METSAAGKAAETERRDSGADHLETPRELHYIGGAKRPTLELFKEYALDRRVPFTRVGAGRRADEAHWLAELDGGQAEGEWEFRIDRGDGTHEPEGIGTLARTRYRTSFRKVWLQDGELFGYPPAPVVSPAKVIKVPDFQGSLPARPLYVYLPRGYEDHTELRYPVLYMHDGQNCFEAFVEDSFSGSWHAGKTASKLIVQGRVRECVIVGVGNGREHRNTEYTPPYVSIDFPDPKGGPPGEREVLRKGYADRTVAYYRDEVARYIRDNYRVLTDRENTATCGSSLGGLFTLHFAWDTPEFARHHAALSPAFGVSRDLQGRIEVIERLRTGARRDIRLWLDCGPQSAPGRGDDGMTETVLARDALLSNGYRPGKDFCYYLDPWGLHNEASWAARFDRVLRFLFP